MGTASSYPVLEDHLIQLIQCQGTIIRHKTAKDFLKTIHKVSPWFLVSGDLNSLEWNQVKVDLQRTLHKEGPNTIPIVAFSLWRLVKDALISDNMVVKEQIRKTKDAFTEAQELESVRTIQTSNVSPSESSPSSSGDETKELRSIQTSNVSSSESSSSSGDEMEEGFSPLLEKGILKLKNKLKRCSLELRPPAYNPEHSSSPCLPSAPPEMQKGRVMFPVIETVNPQGQSQREHSPFTFKDIKQLKEAVMAYGPHAPFTLAIFESFTALNCTPNDWQQLCRVALSGEDYLIWRGEYQELCIQMAQNNAAAGFPDRNLEMLTGTGAYATLGRQILYHPAVYAQISAAAGRAWKALPNKAAGDQLSKILQGPSEPFSEFVDRLLQLVGRIFGDTDNAMPLVRQLAFENANKYCKEALQPHKTRSLNDYIHICRDIDGYHIMGQVVAAAMQGNRKVSEGARPKTCFRCKQTGHFQKNCPAKDSVAPPRSVPGLCPLCKSGYHWARNCRSKTVLQGYSQPPSGNGNRGPLQTPYSHVHGALDTPVLHSIQDLVRDTPGNTGLDLCSSSRAILTPQMGPQALRTGVKGPLPLGSIGLILGRSSALLKGVRVIPGVIEDTEGEIKIMVEAGKGVTVIPQGTRIAQLVLSPKFTPNNPFLKPTRGEKEFGSTGPMPCWVSTMESRPMLTLTIEGWIFQGLLDSGTDTSIISLNHWPQAWPLQESDSSLQVIGIAKSPSKSSRILTWKDDEGHSGIFQPFILPHIPINFWGRDILKAMGAILTTSPVQHMLRKQGYCPGKGIGKSLQGDPLPVSDKPPVQRSPGDRRGLGHF